MIDLHGTNQAKDPLSRQTTIFSQEHALMTLTKDHLISSIGNRLGISKFESLRIIESVLETSPTGLF
jgi:hypothetical protein